MIRRDRAPVAILISSAIVGLCVGFIGVGFFRIVDTIQKWRSNHIVLTHNHDWRTYCFAFFTSALLATIGYFLVKRYAPEASGSGIPEIEGALAELRPVRWWRVIPVKFFGGIGTLGAGMVLGREGPTIQMGGNIGCMIFDLLKLKSKEARHTLIATGAAAGLTAAFNAPLAGILFVIEEMRHQFQYNLISIKAVFIGVITANVVFYYFNGEHQVLDVGVLMDVPSRTLWLYLVLGMMFGVIGVIFNNCILDMQAWFIKFYDGKLWRVILMGIILSGCCGIMALFFPFGVGGGNVLVPLIATGSYSFKLLLVIFFIRMITTTLCFTSGAPGGIFAPMLALGTVMGTAFGTAVQFMLPMYHLQPATFAIAGMGALFAASVRAPLTGIILVLEMTNNYQLILPMIITCLGATLLAQFLGGSPLYSTILTRTIERQSNTKMV